MTDQVVEKQSVTFKDLSLLIVTGLPIMLLAAVVIWGAVQWRISNGQLQKRIQTIYGSDSPSLSLATDYDRQKSRKLTSTVARIVDAAETLSNELIADSDYGEPFEPWAAYPPKDFFDEYARQGKPVLDQLESLLPDLASTWQPRRENSWTYSGFTGSRGLMRLIQCECIDAIYKSKPDRAIRALKFFSYFQTACREQINVQSEHWSGEWVNKMTAIVIPTLERDFWSETHLAELDDLYTPLASTSKFLEDYRRMWCAWRLPHSYSDERSVFNLNSETRLLQKQRIAPSEILPLLSIDFSPTQFNETSLHQQKLKPNNRFDRILPFPFTGTASRYMNHSPFAGEYFLRDCTRLAIAVRRYKKQFGRLPTDLIELRKVGFATNLRDLSFSFHQIENAVYLRNPLKSQYTEFTIR